MEGTTPKRLFTYDDIHATVARLAEMIRKDGKSYDVIVAIGSGGFIPARILKTWLRIPIYAVGVALYDDHNKASGQPRKIQWIDEVERKLGGKRVLLVDEVDDSRKTLAYCVRELLSHGPAALAVAVLHCKDKPKGDSFPQELEAYWAGEHLPDDWLVYPWDVIHPEPAVPPEGQTREDTRNFLLDFGPSGNHLVPVVTQDIHTREVLIMSWTNREGFAETLASGHATYYSRSRKCLWKKGETSGNRLLVKEIRVNCEQDSLLFLVEQEGSGACHARKSDGTARYGCYYRKVETGPSGQPVLAFLDEGPYRS